MQCNKVVCLWTEWEGGQTQGDAEEDPDRTNLISTTVQDKDPAAQTTPLVWIQGFRTRIYLVENAAADIFDFRFSVLIWSLRLVGKHKGIRFPACWGRSLL